MERINRIIKNELYLKYIEKIQIHEKERVFCKHDVTHFLDVCRLAEIDWLNQRIDIVDENVSQRKMSGTTREFIYAAGLLHDIGRWQEYEDGISHEVASGKLAPEILKACGFSETEIEVIVEAIMNHRNNQVREQDDLSGLLYRADKKSRPCFLCVAEKECNWSVTKKNLEIR